MEVQQAPDTDPVVTMNIQEIMEYLPHRYPFLLVDRVTRHIPGKLIEGYKNISMNEPLFAGYTPENPIMPGTLILEAIAQLGGIMVSHMPEGKDQLIMLLGIDKAAYHQHVTPGARLDLKAELIKIKGTIGKASGQAFVDGTLVSEGVVMFALVPRSTSQQPAV